MRNDSKTIQRPCGNRRRVGTKAGLRIMAMALMTVFGITLEGPRAHAQSHLNQNVANHVVLAADCASHTGPCTFKQLTNDGSTVVTDFRIPPGAALVVTDVQFGYRG